MAWEVGQVNEFSDVNSKMDPVILTAAKAVKLPRNKGAFYQAMAAPQLAITQKEFEVRSRSKTVRDGKIGSAWDNSTTASLSVDSESVKGITIGSQLKIGDEIVVVSAVSRANNTIDVFSRGYGGTTAAAHDAASKFVVIGYAGRDVDLKKVDSQHEHTIIYRNAVQTIFHAIDWTKHGTLVRKGLDPAQAQLIVYQEEMFKVAEDLARMSLFGTKNIPVAYNEPYGSAGAFEQLTDTVSGNRPTLVYDMDGGDLTEDKFKAILDEVMRTGNPDTAWMSSKIKRIFDAFIKADTSHVITVDRGERVAGTGIDFYEYNGARIQLRVDADMPDDKLIVCNQSLIKKGWLIDDMLTTKDEPDSSSREHRKSIQGSIGFVIEDVGYEHLLVKNIGGGATERVYKTHLTGATEGVIPPATQTVINTNEAQEVTADPAAASADNVGQVLIIKTGWTEGTNIATAVAGEVWMSNGSDWVKLG